MNYKIKIDELFAQAVHKNLNLVPYKTGNLRYRGVKKTRYRDGPGVYIDDNIAPYGKWIDRPGYKTHGWWDRFTSSTTNDFIQNLNTIGKVSAGPKQRRM